MLQIELTEDLQRIVLTENGNSIPTSRTLWVSDAHLHEKLSPSDRILTVRQYQLYFNLQWIVRPQQLIVVAHHHLHQPELILERVELTLEQSGELQRLALSLPTNLLGHWLDDSSVADGTDLQISFAHDGSWSDRDVRISNLWRPELKPLLDAVNAHLSGRHQITFESIISQREHAPGSPRSRRWDEVRYDELPPVPWWCLWRRQSPHANAPGIDSSLR